MMLEDFFDRWAVIGFVLLVAFVARWAALRLLRRFRWLAPETPRLRPAVERWAEAAVVALIASAWLVALVSRVRMSSTPWIWAEHMPQEFHQQEMTNLTLATLGVGLGVAWWGWKGRSAIVLAGISACVVMAATPMFDRSALWKEASSFQSRALSKQTSDVPVIIRCLDETVGADVFINGERIGQTPCETTLGQLSLVAKRNEPSKLEYLGHGRRGEWLYTPDGESMADEVETVDDRWRDLGYVSLILKGDPGKLGFAHNSTANWSLERQSWHPMDIGLPTYFPARERRWNELLNQIRLRDYQAVTPEWLEALESFGVPGQLALERAISVEPEFRRIFNAWAAWKYGVGSQTSADEAWQVLERIIAESTNPLNRYYPDGLRTRALELVSLKLDSERLTGELEKCLSRYVWMHWPWGRKVPNLNRDFSAVNSGIFEDESRPSGLRSLVLNHVVWFRQQSESTRSHVEETIVPLLLRYGQHESARALGGPVLRRYAVRFLKRKLADPQWLKRQEPLIESAGWSDHWLLIDPSEVAREWRRRNEPLLFRIADGRINSNWQPIDFILEDFHGQPDHRVWRYWRHLLTGQPGKRPMRATLWNFLNRLGQHAPLEAYAAAWKADPTIERSDYWTLSGAFPNQPAARRQAIFKELAEVVGPPAEKIEGVPSTPHDDFARKLAQLATIRDFIDEVQRRDLIEQEVQEAAKSPTGGSESWRRETQKELRSGKLQFSLVRLLAESKVAGARRTAVDFLAAFPIPELRPLLPALLKDADPGVQMSARELQAKLDELARRPPVANIDR